MKSYNFASAFETERFELLKNLGTVRDDQTIEMASRMIEYRQKLKVTIVNLNKEISANKILYEKVQQER